MILFTPPFPGDRCIPEQHAAEGGCFMCCDRCNLDEHQCPGCGEPLTHDGRERKTRERHPRCY